MSIPDLIGAMGVVLIIGAYAALQARRLDAASRLYSALNAVGAALVLVSLAFDFNAPAAAVEVFWLLISLYGLVRARRQED